MIFVLFVVGMIAVLGVTVLVAFLTESTPVTSITGFILGFAWGYWLFEYVVPLLP